MLSAKQVEQLSGSPLFSGVPRGKIKAYLEELGAVPGKLKSGAVLVEQGELPPGIGLLLSGAARGEKLTADGRGIIVNEFTPGDLFGEMLSCAAEKSLVTVVMSADGEVIYIPYSALISGVANMRAESELILRNLISEISIKYFKLMKRLDMLLCPTLRGKIAIYLLGERKDGVNSFVVSHSREEQARLLDCDRSALSRELSRMKREGIIDFSDRVFSIIDMQALVKAAK